MTLAKGPGVKTLSALMGINHIGGEYKNYGWREEISA
jgi:hypothetical protein